MSSLRKRDLKNGNKKRYKTAKMAKVIEQSNETKEKRKTKK